MTLVVSGKTNTLVVLPRHEILGALALPHSESAPDWSNIQLDHSKLVSYLLHGRTRARDRRAVEANLEAWTIRRRYTLEDLSVKTSGDLFRKFFAVDENNPTAWACKRATPEAKSVRDPDLVAALKHYGFELAQPDLAPVLCARPR